MIVKILKMLLILLLISLITACSKPKPQTKIVYRYKEVKVPVKCKVPEVYCDFNKSTSTEVINSLLMCIIEQKRAMEVCK